MQFFNEIIPVEGRIRPAVGQFSLESNPLNWIGCRDRIAALFKETDSGLFFSHDPDEGEPIAKFIWKTENILDLSCRSRFQKTNHNYTLWVAPSHFWMSCGVRRSLLTLLLRQGLHYNSDKDNYEEVLFYNGTNNYALQTKAAILRFLFGFTEYVSPGGHQLVAPGWTSLFKFLDEKQVRRLLREPIPSSEKSMIGAGKLWG